MQIKTYALALLLLVLPFSAGAENPCAPVSNASGVQLANSDAGIGGTGYRAGDESGIGGTGRTGGDESGIGGTGYQGGDESGIGGTGIHGTITAFGSICVNGLRVHYDDETPVLEDGEASNTQALAIGQVVTIEATGTGDDLKASKVAIQSVLAGEITAVDAKRARLTVMGRTVILPDVFTLELKVGQRVVVSGLRRGDGMIDASHIAWREEEQPDGVAGIAHWLDDDVLDVGGVRIAAQRTRMTEIHDGDFVHASGTWNVEQSRIETPVIRAAAAFGDTTSRLSIEGFIERLPGDDRAWIGGVEIDRASLDRVAKRPDVPVRVLGVRDNAGRVRIDAIRRVEVPHRARPILRVKPSSVDERTKPSKPQVHHNPRTDRPKPPDRERPPERPPRPTPPPRPEPIDRPTVLDRPMVIDRPTVIDRVPNKP